MKIEHLRETINQSWVRIRQALGKFDQRGGLLTLVLVLVGATATYLFVSALAGEARQGQRTLAFMSPLIRLLRVLGHVSADAVGKAAAMPISAVIGVALVALAVTALALLRRYRSLTWPENVATASLIPLLAATMLLVLRGELVPAVLTGLLAGFCLIYSPSREPESDLNKWLVLIPVGIGLALRFYALAEIPAGYAEHAAGNHAVRSIPYMQALSASLTTWRLQPFLQTASNALLHEQFGFSSLVAAIGFKLFGVALIVPRFVSAALGTLTIYVAFRLGKALDGVRLGLVFSFLLAVSPWHITISRYGDQEHVLSPLQLLLSLLFVVLAVNGGRLRDIVLAALFTSLAWFIYATNLAVPVIVGLFLLCRAALAPRAAVRNWSKVLLGVGCLALLTYAPMRQLFPRGIFQPSVRTGYTGSGAIFSSWPKRAEMAVLETNQLFRHAEDPWFSFSFPGGGIGVLQSALLVPGLVLATGVLRRRRYQDLALLSLIGVPIAAVPAIFAPDASFRRLMLVATFAALVAAFVLVRLADAARGVSISGKLVLAIACAGAVLLVAGGTFGYFDRVQLPEEASNGWFRGLAQTVSGLLGKGPLLVVVPVRDQMRDAGRYIELASYDKLREAQNSGLPPEALYTIFTCEDPIGGAPISAAVGPPQFLVVAEPVLHAPAPCGPDFVARLKAAYPGSTVVVAKIPSPPPDLLPAQQ